MNTDSFTKHLSFFYLFATLILIFGIMGLALGLYVQFFRGGSQGELMLNNSLLLYSLGLVFSAVVHYQAFNTIKKLKKNGT